MDYAKQPTMPSGGGGLVSTAEDYYRFAQMLANGGELDGKRVLAPRDREADDLEPSARQSAHRRSSGSGSTSCGPASVTATTARWSSIRPAANLPDGKGTFFWDGAAGTWFWVDPTNDIVFVGMIQRMTSPDNHSLLYRTPCGGVPGAGGCEEVTSAMVDVLL